MKTMDRRRFIQYSGVTLVVVGAQITQSPAQADEINSHAEIKDGVLPRSDNQLEQWVFTTGKTHLDSDLYATIAALK